MVVASKKTKAFTLIELLVVLSIIALLLTLAMPRYFKSVDRSKDAALKQDLHTMRDALDKYYSDHAKYPDSLQELVEKNYIRSIPVDPITDSTSTWVTIAPQKHAQGKVFDIKSGASGNSTEGLPYNQY